MQAARAGGADIHAGALAHGLKAFKHLDLGAVVFVLGLVNILCHNCLLSSCSGPRPGIAAKLRTGRTKTARRAAFQMFLMSSM